MEKVPRDIRTLVLAARKLKQEFGNVSIGTLVRKFKITYEKAQQVLQHVK